MMNEAELIFLTSQSEAGSETVATVRLDFEQAFMAYHRVVHRYACALTRDAGLAEDVTQDALHADNSCW